MKNHRWIASASTLAVLAAFNATPALAQSGETEATGSDIVVTAQRREEKSVDVPITITSINEEQLATANVQQLTDIGRITPGLRFDFSSAYVQPNIRGVGSAVVSSGSSGNVGIYVDGFYTPNPLGSAFQLMNVNSIQVLKGPQGTLFGRNTTGGAVLVQTAEPSTENGGQAKASYGRYNEVRAQAYATLGISERVAVDMEGLYSSGDGWQRNVSDGNRVGDYENWSIRLGMKADLSDSVSVLVRYQHAQNNDPRTLLPSGYRDAVLGSGAPFFATPDQYTFNRNEVASGSDPSDRELFRSNTDIVQATIRADLGFANLTSYSQYRKEIVDASLEGDYYGLPFLQTGLPNNNETYSQELLLTSKPGSALQYTAGLFYFQNRDTYHIFIDYMPAVGIFSRKQAIATNNLFDNSTTTKTVAAFADLTYELSPQLFVTLGGRYAQDRIDDAYYINPPAVFGGAPPYYPVRNYIKDLDPASYRKARQSHFTPRFAIRFKPTDETSVYASFTKGYKAALLDVGGGGGNYVKPEKITSFEVGAKYDGNRLSVETSAFYYDYKDLQVSLYIGQQAKILNAAKSEIYGLDAQLRYDLTDSFQISAGGAWVHARYKSFPNAPVYKPCLSLPATDPVGAGCRAFFTSFPVVGTSLRNSTMQRTPEFTGNFDARYKTEVADGQLVLSGSLYYTSKFYFGPSGIQFPQKGYATLALRGQWTDPSDRFTVALWGDNVTNTRYKTAMQYGTLGIGANWNKPTTYGIEIGTKF